MSALPPCGASTRAAALASLNVKSTVIGASPTCPRTPSVPKYFLAIHYSRANRPCYRDGIAGFRHIVATEDASATQRSDGGQRQAPCQALFNRPAQQFTQHGLA